MSLQQQYAVREHALVLDNPNRKYILKVRDMPSEDKPREKLLSSGPQALSIQELLAVVLMTGTKKEEVFAMTSRIMQEYGSRSVMTQKDAYVLAEDLDIPVVKAAQIVACAELGRRFFAKNGTVPTIRTPADVAAHVGDMRRLSKEHLRGLYLNTHYKLIHDETISIGTVDANLIHPREVFKPALEFGAVAVILVHNHPSGVVEPSDADIVVTRQLVEAGRLLGIDLIDHVIVTENSIYSIPVEH